MIALVPTVLLGACALPVPAAHVSNRTCTASVASLLCTLSSYMRLAAYPATVSFGGYGRAGSSVVLLSNFPRDNSSYTATVSADDGTWAMTIVGGRSGTTSSLNFRGEGGEIVLANISFGNQRDPSSPVERRGLQSHSQACPSCSIACDNALSSACHLMFGGGPACLTCTGTHQADLRRAGCSNANLQQYCAVPPPPPPAPKNDCWHTNTCACSECDCSGKTRGGCSNAGTAYCACFGYCSKCH